MRVFQLKAVARFCRSERISGASLTEAVDKIGRGLIDADLGGGLVKQRVARPGAGSRGGYRTIIAFRREHRAIVLFGFAKNALANISDDQLAMLREIGKRYLDAEQALIEASLQEGTLVEVSHDT